MALWILSSIPLITLLFLCCKLDFQTKNSAMISFMIALLCSYLFFGLERAHILISLGKGFVLCLYVSLILIGSIILYNTVDIAGGFKSVETFMKNLKGKRTLKILCLSWTFSGFIQGITGFGVPIVILSAILVGMGVKPLIALMSILIGHSWSISFGSLGTAFYALKLVTRMDSVVLGTNLAVLITIPIITSGVFVAYISGGLKAVRAHLKYIIPIGVMKGIIIYGAAYLNAPHVAAILAGLFGSSVFVIIFLLKGSVEKPETSYSKIPIQAALLPYFLLIFSVLIIQIPQLSDILPQIELAYSFPGFTTNLGFEVSPETDFSAIGFFTHPFSFLMMSSIIGYLYFLYKGYLNNSQIRQIFSKSYNKASSSVITIFMLMLLASLMTDSGMIYMFALGISRFSGAFFPIISPLIGILGAFLTGNNTTSNVLFGAFQVDTARILGYSPQIIAASQSVGGAIGSAIAPAKIIMGISVLEMKNPESDVVKKCLIYTLINGFLVGFAVYFFLQIFT